jgi:hypothetical protein
MLSHILIAIYKYLQTLVVDGLAIWLNTPVAKGSVARSDFIICRHADANYESP